jgi:hypothetical protein
MTRKRETELVLSNAAAVVEHADQARATRLDFEIDAIGAGVERIFDELLHDGGRSFDDLARSYLVDEL